MVRARPVRSTAATAALALAVLGLAGCGSGDGAGDPTPQSPPPATAIDATPAGDASDTPAAEETEEPAEEPTATERSFGDYCTDFEQHSDEVQAIVADITGEWRGFEDIPQPPAEPNETHTESRLCIYALGPSMENGTVVLEERQYPDAAAAAAYVTMLRDEGYGGPQTETREDLDWAETGFYATFNGRTVPAGHPMAPNTSYVITFQDGDRAVRLMLREFGEEVGADEATRRDQVEKILDLIRP